MARHKRGRMALYEVMSKARDKPGYGRTMDKIREQRGPEAEVDEVVEVEEEQTKAVEPETKDAGAKTKDTEAEKPAKVKCRAPGESLTEVPIYDAPDDEEPDDTAVAKSVRWWRKPRIAQIYAGRIEFSMPYQLAIAVFLALVLAVLAAFQLGQRYYMMTSGSGAGVGVEGQVVEEAGPGPLVNEDEGKVRSELSLSAAGNASGEREENTTETSQTTRPPVSKPAVAGGSNAIVMAQVSRDKRADLEQAQQYFEKAGISTELVSRAGSYFLQTTARFSASSSDAAEALKKVKQVGAKYEAPPGYATFAPHLFQDAYLMKVE